MRVHVGAIFTHMETLQDWLMIKNRERKRKRKKMPITIAAKASLSRTNKKILTKYSKWLGKRKFWKQFLNIQEVIPKEGENEYMLQEQREAREVEENGRRKKYGMLMMIMILL